MAATTSRGAEKLGIRSLDQAGPRLSPVLSAGKVMQDLIARAIRLDSEDGPLASRPALAGRAVKRAIRPQQQPGPGIEAIPRTAGKTVQHQKARAIFG